MRYRVAMAVVEINGACAERILDPAFHVARKVGTTLQHRGGWRPARPFGAPANIGAASPSETFAPDANVVAHRLAALHREIEIAILGVDRERSGTLFGWIDDNHSRGKSFTIEICRKIRHLERRASRRCSRAIVRAAVEGLR